MEYVLSITQSTHSNSKNQHYTSASQPKCMYCRYTFTSITKLIKDCVDFALAIGSFKSIVFTKKTLIKGAHSQNKDHTIF